LSKSVNFPITSHFVTFFNFKCQNKGYASRSRKGGSLSEI